MRQGKEGNTEGCITELATSSKITSWSLGFIRCLQRGQISSYCTFEAVCDAGTGGRLGRKRERGINLFAFTFFSQWLSPSQETLFLYFWVALPYLSRQPLGKQSFCWSLLNQLYVWVHLICVCVKERSSFSDLLCDHRTCVTLWLRVGTNNVKRVW